jgi:hypothetical protein
MWTLVRVGGMRDKFDLISQPSVIALGFFGLPESFVDKINQTTGNPPYGIRRR